MRTFLSKILLRLLRLPRSRIPLNRPGLVIIQIDGLSYKALALALRKNLTPFLGKLLRSGFSVNKIYCPLPATTVASEAELFYGESFNIPGFSWYDRISRMFVRADHGSQMKLLEEKFKSVKPLLSDGSCLLAGFRAGATLGTFTAEDLDFPRETIHFLIKLRLVLIPLFNPFRFLLIQLILFKYLVNGMIAGLKTRSSQSLLARLADGYSRIYAGDLASLVAQLELLRQTPALFINFGFYDRLAHEYGPQHRLALEALRLIDLYCQAIWRQAGRERRAYQLIILADHGQSEAIDFDLFAGKTITAAVAAALNQPEDKIIKTYLPAREEIGSQEKIFLVPSCSLINVYFAARLTKPYFLKEIEQKFPGAIASLLKEEGIGWVLVRQNQTRQILFGKNGSRIEFQAGKVKRVIGEPFFDDHDQALRLSSLARFAAMPNIGDLVIFGNLIADRVVAFEKHYRGSHGGFLGEMNWPFILTNNAEVNGAVAHKPLMQNVFAAIRKLR